MSLLLWGLLACRPPATAVPSHAPLSGQIDLIVDTRSGRARLRIWSTDPASARPLPWERNGLALDQCETLQPQTAREGLVFREGPPAAARCGGEALALEESWTGAWVHQFPSPPPPGIACEVELDGRTHELPPLPAAPDAELGRRHLRWTPDGADELRLSMPRSEGAITLCRLRDDGEAIAPRGANRQTAFLTRSRHALPKGEGGQVAIAATAGVWLSP